MSPDQDTVQAKLAEQGLVDPNALPLALDGASPFALPPNQGRLPINPYQAFSAVYNSGSSRTWNVLCDVAQLCSPTDALAMDNDPVIWDAVVSRGIPTAQLEMSVEPQDESDPAQRRATDMLKRCLEETPYWQEYKLTLLRDLYYGKYAVLNRYDWFPGPGGRPELRVAEWWPVNGDKLTRQWGGRWGLLVNGSEYHGKVIGTNYWPAHLFTPEERSCYVISMFNREDADFTLPQAGGRINGAGFRSKLYYIWWMKTNLQGLMLDFMQLVANGFTVYFYEAGNPESLKEVQAAAVGQVGQNILLFPRYKEQGQAGPGVERVEVSGQGAALMQSLVTDYFDGLIRRVILGQSLTSETGRSELGGDAATALTGALSRVVKYDAHRLEWVLYHDLAKVLCAYNCPGVPCPKLRFGVDKPDATKIIDMAAQIVALGGQVDMDYLLEVAGIPKPVAGSPVLSQGMPQQPMAATDVPQGMPMATPAGPAGPPSGNANGATQGGEQAQMAATIQALRGGMTANGAGVAREERTTGRRRDAVRRYLRALRDARTLHGANGNGRH